MIVVSHSAIGRSDEYTSGGPSIVRLRPFGAASALFLLMKPIGTLLWQRRRAPSRYSTYRVQPDRNGDRRSVWWRAPRLVTHVRLRGRCIDLRWRGATRAHGNAQIGSTGKRTVFTSTKG